MTLFCYLIAPSLPLSPLSLPLSLSLPLQRWFVNGEVECFTGSHVALGLLAILVLLVSLLLIPFVFLLAIGRVKMVGYKFYLRINVPYIICNLCCPNIHEIICILFEYYFMYYIILLLILLREFGSIYGLN